MSIEIRAAEFPRDLDAVRRLFREYAAGLGVDLSFQRFDDELSSLPGRYAPPAGRLLIAWRGGEAVGCVAMRAIDAERAEMKRLFVRAEARGAKLGRRLAARIIDEARTAGYARMCLDTLPTMTEAHALYRSLGFTETEPYVHNPVAGTRFLALELRAPPGHLASEPPVP